VLYLQAVAADEFKQVMRQEDLDAAAAASDQLLLLLLLRCICRL
jgi:hypothetical protein